MINKKMLEDLPIDLCEHIIMELLDYCEIEVFKHIRK
jgi:hypothetical protein